MTSFPVYGDAVVLVLVLPALVAVALLGAAIPARRAARPSVAQALRTE